MARPRVLRFRAALRWFTPVWRDIETQTLVALHRAIQRAFQWYDDHMYSFFLSGREWDPSSEYTGPMLMEEEPIPAALKDHPLLKLFKRPRSADVPLRRLSLRKGQRVAYVYDFGDNISVALHLREITGAGKASYPRVVALRGFSPEQYSYVEGMYRGGGYSSRVERRLATKMPPIVKVEGSGKRERDLLLEWSDAGEEDDEE